MGLPDQIVSDSWPHFTSKTFRKFSFANGIKHVTGAPHHSSTNDQAERLVQSFKKGITADKSGRAFQHKLDRFLPTYRSAPHATTALSPAQLLLGRNVRTRLDLIKPDVTRGVEKKLLQSNNSTLKFFVNDQYVWVRNYFRGPNCVRGTVIERTGPVLYRVRVNEQTWRRQVEQLWDSYLTPAIEEGDRVVPGREGRDMWCPRYQKLRRRIHQLRSLHQTGRSTQDQKVSNRALNQSSLLPVLGHPPDSRTLFATSELYFILLFIILCLFCKFTCWSLEGRKSLNLSVWVFLVPNATRFVQEAEVLLAD